MLSAEELRDAYSGRYFGGNEQQKFIPLVENVLGYWRDKHARMLMEYLKSGSTVLDVGCGSGRFLEVLIRHGYNCYGTELAGDASRRASLIKDLKLINKDITEASFDANSFDAVTMWHVLEHLVNPSQSLAEVYRILSEGGLLCISLPNRNSLQAILFRGYWFHLDPPRHLVLPTPDKLIEKLRKLGFTLVQESHLSLEQNPYGFAQSFLNLLFPGRDEVYDLLKGNKRSISVMQDVVLAVEIILVVLLMPAWLAMSAIEAIFGRGGTVELVFRKGG